MVLSKDRTDWWKRAVVYQIYPRSFCDSNGDGVGDINGIASKLGYLKELGVDVLWLSPVYQSPMRDNGYDISDYRAINPEFGTMADFDRLLEQAHGMGLKIVMDLVVNHSSDMHPWFIESRSNPKSPMRDYYIWRDGKNGPPGGLNAPNDWQAWFGGSAWTFDEASGQYFLHLFSPWQPDLNWENPALRGEVYAMMRWWLDKGIDGFRMDVISLISKPQDFPDGNMPLLVANGPRVHEFLREMRRDVLSKYDIMTVGEAACVTLEEAARYANTDCSELDMVFQFEHMELDADGQLSKWNDTKIDLVKLKEVLSRWQNGLYGRAWNSLYWCNHDQPRIVSRLGDNGEYREKSAKMLASCLHFMQGTPYVYQGEELGMTNAPFAAVEDYRDLESINAYEASSNKADMLRYLGYKSRDNARTPMHWNSGLNAGFSSAEPWIMVNPNYREINAEEQMRRNDSVFAYYKKLIQLRREMDIITYGDFELLLPDDPDLFVYIRRYREEKMLVICNFSRRERDFFLPEDFSCADILIANEKISLNKDDRSRMTVHPFDAVVFYLH